MKHLLMCALTLALAACGQKSDEGHDNTATDAQRVTAPATNPQAVEGRQGTTPPPEGNGPQQPQPQQPLLADDLLVGTFELIDNRQSKIRIDPLHIVETNLVIPSPAGDGTRLSPSFPQHLIYDAVNTRWTTIGFFNDATTVFKNVELRIVSYNNGHLLDVTLALPPSGTQIPPVNPLPPQPFPNDCRACPWECPPQPQPNPNDPGNGPPQQQLLYTYRYEKVEALRLP